MILSDVWDNNMVAWSRLDGEKEGIRFHIKIWIYSTPGSHLDYAGKSTVNS